jgi:hypothetical protein
VRKKQKLDLTTIQSFFLDQLMRNSLKIVMTAPQYCLGPRIKFVRNSAGPGEVQWMTNCPTR